MQRRGKYTIESSPNSLSILRHFRPSFVPFVFDNLANLPGLSRILALIGKCPWFLWRSRQWLVQGYGVLRNEGLELTTGTGVCSSRPPEPVPDSGLDD